MTANNLSIARLFNKVVGVKPPCLENISVIAVAREHHDFRRKALILDEPENLQPVPPRHVDIQKHEVVRALFQHFHCFFSVTGRRDFMTLEHKLFAQHLQKCLIVIGDEYSGCLFHLSRLVVMIRMVVAGKLLLQ